MSWAGGDVIRPPGVLPVWCGCRWALLCRSCPPPWWSPGCCLARSPTPRSRYGPSTTASCRPEPDRRATGPSVLVLLVGPATSCFHVLSGELMINTDQKYNLINPIRSWKTLWFTVCFLWATNCINNVCEESSDRFCWSLRTLVWFWGVLYLDRSDSDQILIFYLKPAHMMMIMSWLKLSEVDFVFFLIFWSKTSNFHQILPQKLNMCKMFVS